MLLDKFLPAKPSIKSMHSYTKHELGTAKRSIELVTLINYTCKEIIGLG